MEISGKAYFVSDPRRIEDLTVLHLAEKERPFAVVKTVKLAKIDYENFITDMLADRQFIEDHAALCSKDEVWRCILVQQRGHADGVLVMPEDGCYVLILCLSNSSAAKIPAIRRCPAQTLRPTGSP